MSVALVLGGAAAATAAPAPRVALTLSASSTHVKLGEKVLLSGRAAGLREGSKVMLQEKRRAQIIRTRDGRAVSKAVTISVR
ncbi:hypothetical protein AB0D11_04505 [Streptomyces monashensis]|uniref:hypothetical protein n=1 Tax=Streptomyces monashensis TaxID=1678012 RepID=UPI0033D53C8F